VATLINHTDADLWYDLAQVMVPANGSIEIPDDDVDKVNTVSGVWGVTSAPAPVAERRQVTRGGKTVEVAAAPSMETR
jgi:hypothetical protein